jgi:hypothetical protein
MHVALSMAGHPVRHLLQPPAQFAHVGMEAAMTAFAAAGRMLTIGSQWPYVLRQCFDLRSADRPDDGAGPAYEGLAWDPGWLGKGAMLPNS